MAHSQIRTSDSIEAFAEAFAAAQGEFPSVEKKRQGKIEGQNKEGKSFSYSYAYADIADVLAAALPTLSKHKLAILQPTVMDGGVLTIVTRIVHGGSGQWMESDYPVCSIQGDHKKMGAALTYSRRYAACSMLGIAPEDDTDGDGAEDPVPAQRSAPRQETRRAPIEVTSRLEPPRSAQTPFDDEIPFGPNSGDFEPAVSTKAIKLGRELQGCQSIPDIESAKRTPEFKAAWKDMNEVDRKHIIDVVESLKAKLAKADMMMAG